MGKQGTGKQGRKKLKELRILQVRTFLICIRFYRFCPLWVVDYSFTKLKKSFRMCLEHYELFMVSLRGLARASGHLLIKQPNILSTGKTGKQPVLQVIYGITGNILYDR